MLKNKNFALGTAALLLSTAGFTACSSEDTFSGSSFTGEAVKTQFAINIPVAKSSVNGRLSQEVVQGQEPAPTFRGMSKIKLIPFSGTPSEGTALPSSGAIVLKDISNSELTTGTKFYESTAVPVGTSHFLFYGEATPSGDQTAKTNGAIVAPTEFENGDLAHITGGTLAGLNFDLQGIHTQDNAIEGYLSIVLTNIATSLAENAGDVAELKLAAANMKKFTVGSSAAILAEVQNIYDMVKVGGTSPNTTIADVITGYFNADGQGKLTYKTDAADYKENANDYPNCFGIPANAAAVSSSDGKAFAYVHSDATDFSTYVYPASLYYFVNSAAKTDDELQTWTGSSVNDWAAYVGGYAGTIVTASTQAIALEKSIRYAVAQLVYNVKFGADEMLDAQSIKREVGNNFELTGITIGGQKGVDYKFEQRTGASEVAKTIYDPVTPQAITTTSNSTNFYTLALQSAGSTSGTESVNFALEFVNNGDAFYGQDGLVPKGGTFYLAGTLNADNGTANGYVFKQAYKTTANITINSLKTATYTIPDLRQTQLNLGLSVNLKWEEGLTQDVAIN